MLIRTVLDGRADRNRKHLYHTLLLAASWHANIADKEMFPLEVITVGEPPQRLIGFLQELGIRRVVSEPHPHDGFCPYSNKLLGIAYPAEDRILLLDNDVFILQEPVELLDLHPDGVYASIAGSNSVTPERWTLIQERLGISPRPLQWIPLLDEYWAVANGTSPVPVSLLFCNSGSIVAPPDPDIGIQWGKDIKDIADVFRDHPLRVKFVYGHDQAGFATLCGRIERFGVLPLPFNYRPPCYWLGKADFEAIRILHLTNLHAGTSNFPVDFEGSVRHYWDSHINAGIVRLAPKLPVEEVSRRIAISTHSFERIRATLETYELDRVARSCVV